jgi:hypothetical protein
MRVPLHLLDEFQHSVGASTVEGGDECCVASASYSLR